MMDPKRPLFWHQGLFLQPQHFQQFDLYVQSLLAPLTRYQKPYFWGVNHIQVEETVLQSRMFEVSRGEVIFQDGTWAVFPGNAVVQSRSFEDLPLDLEGDRPFRVYLGLRKWNPDDKNVTSTKGTDDLYSIGTRYICPIDPEGVNDLYHDGPSASIRSMSYALKYFWETEIEGLGNYWLIPIAQLETEGADIRLSRDFIPPAIALSGSEVLMQVLLGIREQITSRCRVLESYKLTRDIRISDFEGNYLRYLLALASLNRYVPILYHITDTPEIHPWAAFGLLRQIIGELSTFTDRINALGKLMDGTDLLPDYDHKELATCFNEAQTLIGELLSAIIVGEENVVQLVRDDRRFQGQIPLDAFTDRSLFCLVVKTAGDPDRIVKELQQIVKLGSSDQMSTLLARALPGISLEHRPSPPPGIPKRPDSYYFLLDRSHPQWLELKRTGLICLYWDDAPEDATVELVITRI